MESENTVDGEIAFVSREYAGMMADRIAQLEADITDLRRRLAEAEQGEKWEADLAASRWREIERLRNEHGGPDEH